MTTLKNINIVNTLSSVQTFFSPSNPGNSLAFLSIVLPLISKIGIECKRETLEGAIWKKLFILEFFKAIGETDEKFSWCPEDFIRFINRNKVALAGATISLVVNFHALKILRIFDERKLAALNIASGVLGLLQCIGKVSSALNKSSYDLEVSLEIILILFFSYFSTRVVIKGISHFEAFRPYIPTKIMPLFSEEKFNIIFRFSAALEFIRHFYKGYKDPMLKENGSKKSEDPKKLHSFTSYYLSELKAKGIVELTLLILSYVDSEKKTLLGDAIDLEQAAKHLEDLRQQLFLSIFVGSFARFLEGAYRHGFRRWGALFDLFGPLKDFGSGMKWLAVGSMVILKDWKDVFSNMKNGFSIACTVVKIYDIVCVFLSSSTQKKSTEEGNDSCYWKKLQTASRIIAVISIIFQATLFTYNAIEYVKRKKWAAITESHLQQTRLIMTLSNLLFFYAEYRKKILEKNKPSTASEK